MIPAPHIAAMAPYALARMEPPDGKPLISLSQNESLRPPCPAAQRALGSGADYPDPDWADLRGAIGAAYGVDPERLLCGAGSLDLIGALMRVYAGPKRAVLMPAHSYPFFRSAAAMVAAPVQSVAETDFTADIDAMLAAVTPETGIVCLANPANPTGTRVPLADVVRLRAGLREDILLILDEAYGEFADGLDGPSWPLVDGGNVVVLRTLSKAYGLAGARIGWGVFPGAVAAEVRKVLNPNGLPAASQAAGIAGLQDQGYMRETVAMTADARGTAVARLQQMNVPVVESLTNFVLMPFQSAEAAARLDAGLRAEGIFLRPQGGAGLPHALRMTIGPQPAMEVAFTTLERLCR